jgi:hypothetical protein
MESRLLAGCQAPSSREVLWAGVVPVSDSPLPSPHCEEAGSLSPRTLPIACHSPGNLLICRSATDRSLFEVWMKKGEATRRRIVAQAAGLLNTQGYRSTPVSEIMRVTGLRKGGIYRHFKSRTTLTLEAFETPSRGRVIASWVPPRGSSRFSVCFARPRTTKPSMAGARSST